MVGCFVVTPARAVDRAWQEGLYLDAFQGTVRSHAVFDDDGDGPNPPALYVGGNFSKLPNGEEAWGIVKWDGQTWTALPPLWHWQNRGVVYSMAVYDADGPGGSPPVLAVGGMFNSQTRNGTPDLTVNQLTTWNGSSWQPLAGIVEHFSEQVLSIELSGAIVATALHVHDDGSGPALYAGGNFRGAGSVICNGVAKWDGSNWSELGSGVLGVGAENQLVSSMCTHDPDGPGGAAPRLYIAGNFWNSSKPLIAQWNGSGLSVVGPNLYSGGLAASIDQLVSYNGALYARTSPQNSAVNTNVLRWNGSQWSQPIAIGADLAMSLAVHDDGSGPALFIGMNWSQSGGAATVARKWNGSTFQDIGTALYAAGKTGTDLLAFDLGSGPRLISPNGLFQHEWNGTGWVAVNENGNGTLGTFRVITHADLDGTGGQPGRLYAAGFANFGTAVIPDLNTANGATGWVGAFDGDEWSILGPALTGGGFEGLEYPYSSGGDFSVIRHIASGPAAGLYVAGRFDAGGGSVTPLNSVARWDGSAWQRVGTAGVIAAVNYGSPPAAVLDVSGTIYDAVEYDPDGTGPLQPRLVVAGDFDSAGGVPATNIAQWDGANWSALGDGLNGVVSKLAVVDFPGGTKLFAGGRFSEAGGVPARKIAQWNGSTWSSLGSGLSVDYPPEFPSYVEFNVVATVNDAIRISAMSGFADANGPGLVVAGNFTHADGVFVNQLARWNGAGWSPMTAGLPLFHLTAVPPTVFGEPYKSFPPFTGDYTGQVIFQSFTMWDDGTGPALYAAGWSDYYTGAINGTQLDPPLSRIVAMPQHVAKWTGTQWEKLTDGGGQGILTEAFSTFPEPKTLAMGMLTSDGAGPSSSLFVSGGFRTVEGLRSSGLAVWSPVETPCLGDHNGDGVVDLADLISFNTQWQPNIGLSVPPGTQGDYNADGVVDLADLIGFNTDWQPSIGVPCP